MPSTESSLLSWFSPREPGYQGALQILTGGIAGFQLERAINVLRSRIRSVFPQIEARQDQIRIGRLPHAQRSLGFISCPASIAASVVIFGESVQGLGTRRIDAGRMTKFGLGLSRESMRHEFLAEFDVKAGVGAGIGTRESRLRPTRHLRGHLPEGVFFVVTVDALGW